MSYAGFLSTTEKVIRQNQSASVMKEILTQRQIYSGEETILLFPGKLEAAWNSTEGTAELTDKTFLFVIYDISKKSLLMLSCIHCLYNKLGLSCCSTSGGLSYLLYANLSIKILKGYFFSVLAS